ncbi:MAG TPA: DUF6644 family protein [Chryseosolibacter sp.]|nr:DUF6644 family protein [Chryseosolibacter sp.]
MRTADVFEWLEASTLAAYIRQSHVLYPVIELIHILGFIFLVGSAFLFDLRLLGLSRKIPVTDLSRHLLPWSRRSLLLVIPSGFLLFMTEASTLGTNRVLGIKLTLILLAFINAGYFHRFTFTTVSQWDQLRPPPTAARAAGIISLLLWTGVITCGRFLAYFE